MLTDPKTCDHHSTAKQNGKIICLLCMQEPEKVEQENILRINAGEDVGTAEAVK